MHYDAGSKSRIGILTNWGDYPTMYDKMLQFDEFIEQALKFVVAAKKDCYFTINSFYRPTARPNAHNKSSSNAWHLNALVIDYDFYKLEEYKDYTPSEMYHKHIKDTLQFLPSSVIDSGRGLYVIYNLEHASKRVIKYYKAIYEALIKNQKRFGADDLVSNVTQVIRVPGTINSRTGTRVEIIETNDIRYKLTDFKTYLQYSYDEVISFKKEMFEKMQMSIDTINQDKESPPGKKKTIYKISPGKQHFENVYKDFKTLVKIRNESNWTVGYRELILYYTRYFAVFYGYTDTEAINYALKLNGLMKVPINEKQMIAQTRPSEIFKYLPTIKTIRKKLMINSEEEIYLHTLVSDSLKEQQTAKKKRNKERLMQYGYRTRKEYEVYMRRWAVIKLKREGLRNKDIAERLKQSPQIIGQDLKYINSNKALFNIKIEEILRLIEAVLSDKKITRTSTPEAYLYTLVVYENSREGPD